MKKNSHLSEEAKRKISIANSGKNSVWYGRHHTEETKRKIREGNLGKIISEETKKRISITNYGKHLSDEHKRKISNENNKKWKGDDVGYSAMHIWVKRRKPKPDVCEICNHFKPEDCSNISGEYKRDVNDFQWLCTMCHSIYDRQIRETLGGYDEPIHA